MWTFVVSKQEFFHFSESPYQEIRYKNPSLTKFSEKSSALSDMLKTAWLNSITVRISSNFMHFGKKWKSSMWMWFLGSRNIPCLVIRFVSSFPQNANDVEIQLIQMYSLTITFIHVGLGTFWYNRRIFLVSSREQFTTITTTKSYCYQVDIPIESSINWEPNKSAYIREWPEIPLNFKL